MDSALPRFLSALPHSGQEGFEGLIAELLERLTGQRFFLARSGTQHGRDMRSGMLGGSVVAVECKHYSGATSFDHNALLGEIDQAERDIPDLDLWVLATTRSVPDQLATALQKAARSRGVEFRAISHEGRSGDSLDVLCALAPELVASRAQPFLGDQVTDLREYLNLVRSASTFADSLEALRSSFSATTIGYETWRAQQNQWLLESLSSDSLTTPRFGQTLNVLDQRVPIVERLDIIAELDDWWAKWGEGRETAALLGDEGDGKSWAVARWLANKVSTDDAFPSVVFASSGQADSDQPLELVASLIARQLGSQGKEFWERRFRRWLARPVDSKPLLVIVIDGPNECREPKFWRSLLSCFMAGGDFAERIGLVVTCRTAFWDEDIVPSYLSTRRVLVGPYDDGEFARACQLRGLRLEDIDNSLLPLIRKPRYFDLASKHMRAMAESGDVTVPRLMYLDWKDRYDRKISLAVVPRDFEAFIMDLARASADQLEGVQGVSRQDVEESIGRGSQMVVLQELRTSGVLLRQGSRYRVDPNHLNLGLGLVLADVVERAVAEQGDPGVAIEEWIQPYAGMDIMGPVLETSVLQALYLQDQYPASGRVALLDAWLGFHNAGRSLHQEFVGYLPIHPVAYLELAESVWSATSPRPSSERLIMEALLHWRDLRNLQRSFPEYFERWLGYVPRYGFPLDRGRGNRGEEIAREIEGRVGHELTTGFVEYAGQTLSVTENDGLLRLGRVALVIISHVSRVPYIQAVVKGCLAEALADYPGKYDLFAWVLRSSASNLLSRITQAVQQLSAWDLLPATQAAYRLLSYEGGTEAAELRKGFSPELFPARALEEWEQDACRSPFAWTKGVCEECCERADLDLSYLVRRLKPFARDPALQITAGFRERLAQLTPAIQPESLWANQWQAAEDHLYDEIEPALCAFAPNILAELVRAVAMTAEGREGTALRMLSGELGAHRFLLGEREAAAVNRAWSRLSEYVEDWTEEEQLTEAFLLKTSLHFMDAAHQLRALLSRRPDAMDLLAFEPSFKPICQWDEIRQVLQESPDAASARRVLWFLWVHPELVPPDLVPVLLSFIRHHDSVVRKAALRLLFDVAPDVAAAHLIEHDWRWSGSERDEEDHWGSLILCRYLSLSYDRLRSRIPPSYLGYAVQLRGLQEHDVEAYAQDMDKIWQQIREYGPELPVDFPLSELTCDPERGIVEFQRIGLSMDALQRSIHMADPDAHWGGLGSVDEETLRDLFAPTAAIDRQRKLTDVVMATIQQQLDRGNSWFGFAFGAEALEEVIKRSPGLLEAWLSAATPETAEGRRLLTLARSFYETLCTELMRLSPEQGLDLFRRLESVPGGIETQVSGAGLPLLRHVLFAIPETELTAKVWDEQLRACRSNHELMTLTVLAEGGSAGEWLRRQIEVDLQSDVLFDRARATALLGFVGAASEAERRLEGMLPDDGSKTWIRNVVAEALDSQRLQRWAAHWYRQYLAEEEPVASWAAFRVFLACVDNRFWSWRVNAEGEADVLQEERLAFVEESRSTIKNAIRRNEKGLGERFLAHKILDGQAWPWM
jgi:hypothetical protein